MAQKKYYGLELQADPPYHLNNDDIFTLLSQNTEQGAWKLFNTRRQAEKYIEKVNGIHTNTEIVVVELK